MKAVTTKSRVLPTGLSESKSASVGLDRLIGEEAGLGNTCLLRNVISFFFLFCFCFTQCVIGRKKVEDSQIPRLVLS